MIMDGADRMTSIPDADALRDLLAARGAPPAALVEPAEGEPFYVGLNAAGELVKLERS